MTALRSLQIHRGHVLFAERRGDGKAQLTSFEDGALVVNENGTIQSVGVWNDSLRDQPGFLVTVSHWGRSLIVPGFVDTHIHFPQTDIIASHGEDLLGWLTKFTFPAESRYSDLAFAELAAERFLTALLESGTTSAAIYSSSHLGATELLFESCLRRGIRAAIGQVAMDKHAPSELVTKNPDQFKEDFARLYENWHGRDGRLKVALTPRFAPSCSGELLKACSELAAAYSNALIQTHYAESLKESEWVKKLFPHSSDYLAVYEDNGLVTDRTILAHAIHVTDDEMRRLIKAGASVSHCPSSNLFLGSGIMAWQRYQENKLNFALGTDVGAGTWFSLWKTMGDAYKSQRLLGYSVDAAELLARATVDGADILSRHKSISGFAPGAAADFQVVDWTHSHLLKARADFSAGFSAHDLLFSLYWHWESAMTEAVYVSGNLVFDRSAQQSASL